MSLQPLGNNHDFVEHPRFGRAPRFTDVRPGPIPPGYRLTTFVSYGIIEGTAVVADLERQSVSPVPVLYYFDLGRICIECSRPFIFFAEEQKHWYETLGFDLGCDCVRCPACRKKQHRLKRQAKRYAELLHAERRSVEETLELCEQCLDLIKSGIFDQRKEELVRMLLNKMPEDRDEGLERRSEDIRRRLRSPGDTNK